MFQPPFESQGISFNFKSDPYHSHVDFTIVLMYEEGGNSKGERGLCYRWKNVYSFPLLH